MAIQLDFKERRVLGVLMEKAFATPEQYPLTLNSLVNGSNQKSCRDPVCQLTEDAVLDALDSLREKELVTLVRAIGGRTDRYKHRAGETLGVDGRDAAVLAELLLRGPQTDGELRQRATRLQPISDLSELAGVLEGLSQRETPLVRRLSAAGRRRGVRFSHTLYRPGEEPTEQDEVGERIAAPPETGEPASGPSETAAPPPRVSADTVRREIEELAERLGQLENRVDQLGSTIERLLEGS